MEWRPSAEEPPSAPEWQSSAETSGDSERTRSRLHHRRPPTALGVAVHSTGCQRRPRAATVPLGGDTRLQREGGRGEHRAALPVHRCDGGQHLGIDRPDTTDAHFVELVLLLIPNCDFALISLAVDYFLEQTMRHKVGRSFQTAQLIEPLVVLLAWWLGIGDVTLAFDGFEVVSLFTTILLLGFLMVDTKVYWVHGVLLLVDWVCLVSRRSLCLRLRQSDLLLFIFRIPDIQQYRYLPLPIQATVDEPQS